MAGRTVYTARADRCHGTEQTRPGKGKACMVYGQPENLKGNRLDQEWAVFVLRWTYGVRKNEA